jgi:hypothetical protein
MSAPASDTIQSSLEDEYDALPNVWGDDELEFVIALCDGAQTSSHIQQTSPRSSSSSSEYAFDGEIDEALLAQLEEFDGRTPQTVSSTNKPGAYKPGDGVGLPE